jgi:hypothetical protein
MERFWKGAGALLFLLVMPPLAGCYVKERTVACPPAATQVATGCVWVQDYRDGYGRVHAAHWRCPGTIDAY